MKALTRWFMILLLLVMVLAWNYLAGCAQVPLCDKFQYQVWYDSNGQPFYVLNEHDAVTMIRMVEGLQNGTCRLESPH